MPERRLKVPGHDETTTITEARWPATEQAPRNARAWTRSLLDGVPRVDLSDVELMISELVTNACQHTRTGKSPDGEVRVAAICEPARFRFEVTDSGGDTIPSPRCSDADEEAGRGLLILNELADDWGHQPSLETGGRTVWFEVDREPLNPDAGAHRNVNNSMPVHYGLA